MPFEVHTEDNVILTVQNISLYIRGVQILNNVTFNLERGKTLGLIGRNGSGKTMLMKCLCGFIIPTAGEIVIDGLRIGKDCDFPPDVGLIIETPGFIPYYSGIKNLSILASLKNKIGEDEICRAMESVGLNPNLRLPVRKYSLGMRQRLGLAQAIMESPSLLILDEPMNGLDKQGVVDMRSYLLNLKQQGKTIVIASHNSEDIKILCDDVYEMDRGTLHKADLNEINK